MTDPKAPETRDYRLGQLCAELNVLPLDMALILRRIGLAIVSEADLKVLEASGAVHRRWLESYLNIIVPTQADPQAFAWAEAELARRIGT